jgi:hypothetical protein
MIHRPFNENEMNWKHLAFALTVLSYHCMASALPLGHLSQPIVQVWCCAPAPAPACVVLPDQDERMPA